MDLELRLRRWQFASLNRMDEAHPIMASVAKWLVLRMAAAAKRDHGTPGKPETGARGVADFKFALDPDRTVAEGSDFRWHQWDGTTGQDQGNSRRPTGLRSS